MRSLSRDEVRAVDQAAIVEFGLPGLVLMENAGRGAAECLLDLGVGGKVTVCAGKGNNGGDGFVMARHLDLAGVSVEILLVCTPEELTGDAAVNFHVVERSGVPLRVIPGDVKPADLQATFSRADWIVDALLGTGARGAPRAPIDAVIAAINHSHRQVFAVDLPSGLDCDTGIPAGVCIRAAATATFVAPKSGFNVPGAGAFTGTVHVVDIGVPRILRDRVLNAKTS